MHHRESLLPLALLFCGACPGGGGDGTGADSSGSTTATDGTATLTTAGTEPTASATMTATSMTTDADSSSGGTTDGTSTTGELPCPYTPIDGMPELALVPVASGFDRPVLALGHPTEPDRLFVVEQGGNVRILEPGATTAPDDAFLSIDVVCGNNPTIGCEAGLLGFAFHPQFPTDPRVYVAYSAPDGDGAAAPTRVSEFMLADGDADHVDPTSERIVIEAAEPFGNHNGGMIAFGPDGNLYIGLGDGGDGGDTPQTGRDPSVILAKILRIDVEPDGTPDNPVACIDNPGAGVSCAQLGPFDYTIPPDNPFVDDGSFAPEIFAWGFRNPWRFAFDADNGDLWVGDVGQGAWEEVDLVVGGGDYGWSSMEGFHCFNGPCEELTEPNAVNGDGMTMPLLEYGHGPACSITGGAVYRSCEVPAWSGLYVYGDYCTGELSAAAWDGTSVTDFGAVLSTGERILGNGWNAYGDVFITTVDAPPNGPISDGLVYRLSPQ
ncbi:MAG: PQQ-dependent sugar dehydrogenase [Deltaproteobacteria bacterium]|nr:PQQ-dependent sugar dehydrogenase [Deltaproteobacteria bacterium]MBK8234250.1 PQQ-dependent sugar dehydrogenase [Deltaproteobacteria bacterium]MBK8714968.1 PQQ-dependent sugar dehydrogenase [Deltaproteobacteria bacterium]MBP7290423.1 PQQ-dependent sugar dehydrogenase [Nannocystaceae bacterium]